MKLFIFDMGGVLARDFDVLPEAARLLGMPEPALRDIAALDMTALMTGAISAPEYWSRLEARTGTKAREDYWSTLFSPNSDPEVESIIRGLRSRGRVVCGTNTIASHYEYLHSAGMYECFDAVYASHAMGLCKPDPAFWLGILDSEGIEAGDAYFVDDMAENVEAARKLGIASFLFQGAGSLALAIEDALDASRLLA